MSPSRVKQNSRFWKKPTSAWGCLPSAWRKGGKQVIHAGSCQCRQDTARCVRVRLSRLLWLPGGACHLHDGRQVYKRWLSVQAAQRRARTPEQALMTAWGCLRSAGRERQADGQTEQHVAQPANKPGRGDRSAQGDQGTGRERSSQTSRRRIPTCTATVNANPHTGPMPCWQAAVKRDSLEPMEVTAWGQHGAMRLNRHSSFDQRLCPVTFAQWLFPVSLPITLPSDFAQWLCPVTLPSSFCSSPACLTMHAKPRTVPIGQPAIHVLVWEELACSQHIVQECVTVREGDNSRESRNALLLRKGSMHGL